MPVLPTTSTEIITLSSTGLNPVQYDALEGYVALGFECATVVPEGTVVKLASDGTVAVITATTDPVIGVVGKGNKVNGGRVTLITKFRAVVIGIADGAITAGGIVDAEAVDSGSGLMKYKATASNGNQIGIALQTVIDTNQVMVGIL